MILAISASLIIVERAHQHGRRQKKRMSSCIPPQRGLCKGVYDAAARCDLYSVDEAADA